MVTAKEGVTVVFNDHGELVGMIYKELKTRNNVLFKCAKMNMEDIERLLVSDIVRAKSRISDITIKQTTTDERK